MRKSKRIHKSRMRETSGSVQKDLTLYHISHRIYEHNELVYPSIPHNYLTDHRFENTKTPRICAAHNIDSCLTALHRNLCGERLHVYKIEKPYRSMYPTIKDVPDVEITNEVWVLDPVHMTYQGDIEVTESEEKPIGTYDLPNQKAIPLYRFLWRWVF